MSDKTVPIPVKSVLAVRDALVEGDCDEAYHQLYWAFGWKDPFNPWAELEAAVSPDTDDNRDISANWQVVPLLKELEIEGSLVPNRRGELYRLAKARIEEAEALLRYYDIPKVIAYLKNVDRV